MQVESAVLTEQFFVLVALDLTKFFDTVPLKVIIDTALKQAALPQSVPVSGGQSGPYRPVQIDTHSASQVDSTRAGGSSGPCQSGAIHTHGGL